MTAKPSTRILVYSSNKETGSAISMGIMENLPRIRKAKGFSQVKLAKEAGVSQQLISRLESGADQTSKKLPDLARVLGVAIHEIDENFTPEGAETAIKAPLLSWVSAGALVKPDITVIDLTHVDWVSTMGLKPDGKWIALEVVGDSMDRISPPESIIFVNLKDRRLVPNACYVIEDAETGGTTYKRYRPDPDRWEPVSENKRHKAIEVEGDRGPRVIGRVRRTVLDL